MLITYLNNSPINIYTVLISAVLLTFILKKISRPLQVFLVKKLQANLHREGQKLHAPMNRSTGRNAYEVSAIWDIKNRIRRRAENFILVAMFLTVGLLILEFAMLPSGVSFWACFLIVFLYPALSFLFMTFAVNTYYILTYLWEIRCSSNSHP